MRGFLKLLIMKNICCTYFLLLFLFNFFYSDIKAQETMPVNETDSIAPGKSSLQVGISFSSRALSSGRDFGVSQYIVMPSINYSHKSGFYAGVYGNILSDVSPKYSLTTIALGYADSITSKWNYNIGYSRNIFNPDTAGLIKNSLSASIIFSVKHFNTSIQYAYLFGNEKAHRFTAGANGDFYKSFDKVIDEISFTPGVLFTFGTANVPFSSFSSTQFQKGTGQTWQQWKLQRLRPRMGTSTALKKTAIGLMNIDLLIPVIVTVKKFQLGLSYNYALPKKLSEENGNEVNTTGYFGVSLGYTIK
jgi:Bacterial protein of unknown function (Gcw_chp)